MIGACREVLETRATEWGLPGSGMWRVLFHNNHHPHCSNVNLIWFCGRGAYPLVVTKLSPEAPILEREFGNLQRVYDTVPIVCPRPLSFGRYGRFWGIWMAGVPGRRMTVESASGRVLNALARTVAEMHNAVRERSGGSRTRHEIAVMRPLETMWGFGSSAAVKAGCDRLRERCTPEWLASLPSMPQHGDLFAGNVLLHGEGCHFIDWESFGVIDLPFYDVLTLLLSLLREDGEEPREWSRNLVARCRTAVNIYSATIGVPVTELAHLLPLTLANWFHLQVGDGRAEFGRVMYNTIVRFFESPSEWLDAFTKAESLKGPSKCV
jgi:aminoglycoside phosphotransferase (APT) family kinase protein